MCLEGNTGIKLNLNFNWSEKNAVKEISRHEDLYIEQLSWVQLLFQFLFSAQLMWNYFTIMVYLSGASI